MRYYIKKFKDLTIEDYKFMCGALLFCCVLFILGFIYIGIEWQPKTKCFPNNIFNNKPTILPFGYEENMMWLELDKTIGGNND